MVFKMKDPELSKTDCFRANQDTNGQGAGGSCKNAKDEEEPSRRRNGSLDMEADEDEDEEEIPCAGLVSCFSPPPEWQARHLNLRYTWKSSFWQVVCDQQATEAGEQFFRRFPNFWYFLLLLSIPQSNFWLLQNILQCYFWLRDNIIRPLWISVKTCCRPGCATPSSSPPRRPPPCPPTWPPTTCFNALSPLSPTVST